LPRKCPLETGISGPGSPGARRIAKIPGEMMARARGLSGCGYPGIVRAVFAAAGALRRP